MTSEIILLIIVFILLLLWWLLHYIIIDWCDKLSFKQLKFGDVFVNRHYEKDHQYDMYFNHVIVIGKDTLENNRRIVKFRDLNKNVYNTLDWHEFRYFFEYTNKNLY